QSNGVVRRIGPDGIISTIAGTGAGGYSGDGGPATKARLNGPQHLTRTKEGGFYVADTNNHAVRYIAPDGVITTVAGIGISGNVGDGGPATAARVSNPVYVAAGPDGDLYIATSNRVRQVGL